MPYSIRTIGASDYAVVNKVTGKVESHHKTKDKARKAIRARYANEDRERGHRWFRRR